MAMQILLLLDIYYVPKLENSQENGKVTFFPTNLLMGGIMGSPVCWHPVKRLQIASAKHYRLSD